MTGAAGAEEEEEEEEEAEAEAEEEEEEKEDEKERGDADPRRNCWSGSGKRWAVDDPLYLRPGCVAGF